MAYKNDEKTIYCYYSEKQNQVNSIFYVYKDIDNKGKEIYCTEVNSLHPDIFLKNSNFDDMKYLGKTDRKKGFIKSINMYNNLIVESPINLKHEINREKNNKFPRKRIENNKYNKYL